jgi:hypothetical protein
MTATTAVQAGEGTRRRFRRRHLWLIPGLAIAIVANQLGSQNGVGIWALIAFGIAPDLPRLFGINGSNLRGARSWAQRAFNLVHDPIVASGSSVVVGIAVVVAVLPVIWLVGALIWVSHVVVGWGVGDVRRRSGRSDG